MKKVLLSLLIFISVHAFAQQDSIIYLKVPIGGGGSITATGAPDSTYFRIVNSTGRNYRISALGVSSSGTVTGNTTTTNTAPVQQIVTTGDVTINNTTNLLIYNNAATSASVTITLPATPTDGQSLGITFINAVTTFALLPNTGQSISQSFVNTSMSAGEYISYTWINSLSKWIAK